jgi:hypothetical protein
MTWRPSRANSAQFSCPGPAERASKTAPGSHGDGPYVHADRIAADARLAGGSGASTIRRLLSVAPMLLGATIRALLVLTPRHS